MPQSNCITDNQATFFIENGYLVIPSLLYSEELARIQSAMQTLVATPDASNPDYQFSVGHRTGNSVLRRIEYVIDKSDEMRALLGHPFVLRSVEMLQGSDFIPTWDSMVLKMPGEGIVVPWHRDAAAGKVGDHPIFNVDFYLDEATEENCLWIIPGSNHWPREQVDAWLLQRHGDLTPEDFRASGAIPVPMQPGDVLFHDILVLHGSPATETKRMRRVVYYEFRPAHIEAEFGPHIPEYIPLKQKVLLACLNWRWNADYVEKDETPFVYEPPAPYNAILSEPVTEPASYRYVHQDFWRA